MATGQPIGEPVGTAGSAVYSSVVGDASSKYVTIADNRLQVWNFDVDHYPDMACQAAGRNMTAEEWKLYGPRNEACHATCAQWPAEYAFCPDVQSCATV